MYDPNDVVILIPTWQRPYLLDGLIENIAKTTPHAVTTVFLPHKEDRDTLEVLGEGTDGVRFQAWVSNERTWATKINAGARLFISKRYIFCGADDVIFEDGWLDEIFEVMGTYDHAHDVTRVVGTLDMLTGVVMDGEHATHFMVDRQYLGTVGGVADEGPGSFLFDGYTHNYVDTEFIGTAKARGVFAPSEAVVRHAHHLGGFTPYDSTYRWGDDSKLSDARIFEVRRHLWEDA